MPESISMQEPEATEPAIALRALGHMKALQDAALALEAEYKDATAAAAACCQASARNLIHYLAVRSYDIRELQADLARLGLSSLGRMEAHTMASLQRVICLLHALIGTPPSERGDQQPAELDVDAGNAMLFRNASTMLWPADVHRNARIMVTMPVEAATDPTLIHDLLAQGMQIMRINCAHDSPLVWARMLRHLRHAERQLGRTCKVSFDLAGPKLRTGPIAPGVRVLKWRPQKDDYGRVTAPAVVRLAAARAGQKGDKDAIPVHGDLIEKARPGDKIELADARGRRRRLDVIDAGAGGCSCQADRTAYVVPGTKLRLRRNEQRIAKAVIGGLAAAPAKNRAQARRPA